MQKDDDSGSDDDLDTDEMALCRQIATEMVPDLVPRLQRALISYLEEDGIHGQQLSEIETALNSSLNEIVPKLASLGKLSKSSGWRKIEPVDPTSYSNKAVGQHLHSHLQSVLADVGKRVTEHIRNSLAHFGKADDDPAASIASNADLSGLLEINLGDDLSEVAGDSSYRTLTRLGVGDDSDTMDEAISSSENLSRARSESIVKGTSSSPQDDYNITQSTRDMIQRIVSSGLAAGKTSDEITSDVNDQVFGSDRAGAISDYELANASTIGTMQALESASDAGLNLMKGWLTAGDSRVDEDICRENERQGPIPLDQAFQSGHMAPLGHPGCRCALVGYVASDSE
jgi:hypothetical protein